MGRPRKTIATSTGKVGKKNKNKRAEQEKKLKLDREGLVIPGWLQDDLLAHNEFVRVVNEAGKIDILDNLDLSILAIYCKAYSSYIECTEHIKQKGYTGIGKDGFEKISPYVTAQNKYVEQIFKCSTKLGLATTDRLKLIVPVDDVSEVNKFLKYVK